VLRQNLRYKIIALLLAIAMWLYVSITQRNPLATQTFTVPVELRGVEPKTIASVDPPRVRVVLRGRADDLAGPWPTLPAFVNAARARSGRQVVEVGYVPPPNIQVVRIQPRIVKLTIEPIVTKTMKVEANMVGTPPPGYVLGEPQISPPAVNVSGVRGAVAQVSHVVVNVDVNVASLEAPQTNMLRPVDDAGEVVAGIRLSRAEARVVIPVKRTLSYATVPVVLQTDGEPAQGYRIRDASLLPPVVTIAGEAARLRQVSSVRTVTVDLTDADADMRRVVRLVLPDGVTTVSQPQVQVVIHIEREPVAPAEPAAPEAPTPAR
jgi:YbbR domain-containing protein